MRKTILILAAAFLVAGGCRPMPRQSWSRAPYRALCHLMDECRKEAKAAGRNVNYAVFDYDDTVVMQDLEYTFTFWQIENLHFNLVPEDIWEYFPVGIPDLDSALVGLNRNDITSRMLITDISSDYAEMLSSAGVSCGNELSAEQLEKLKGSDIHKDFTAKTWALLRGVADTFGYMATFQVMMALKHNMNYSEYAALAREDIAVQMSKKQLSYIQWNSRDTGAAGKVTVYAPDGLALPREMRSLCRALPKNGIDVYFISATLEDLAEIMACDEKYFGLDTAQVFGFRMELDSLGNYLQTCVPGYIEPYYEAKAECVKAYIAPLYDGRDPVLAAGDGNGDYAMLTSFPGMRVGLIPDKRQSEGGIAELRRQAIEAESGGAPSVYVLQRRADPKPKFRRK